MSAVEKGRVIYAGIQKFVAFIMSAHIAEVMQIFLCIVMGIPVMRTPQQILFLILQLARLPVPVHGSEALRCAERPRGDLQVPGNGWPRSWPSLATTNWSPNYKYTGEPGAYGAGFPGVGARGPQEEAQL